MHVKVRIRRRLQLLEGRVVADAPHHWDQSVRDSRLAEFRRREDSEEPRLLVGARAPLSLPLLPIVTVHVGVHGDRHRDAVGEARDVDLHGLRPPIRRHVLIHVQLHTQVTVMHKERL